MAFLLLDSANGGDGATRWSTYSPQAVDSATSPSGRASYRNQTGSTGIAGSSLASTNLLVAFYGKYTDLNQDNSVNSRTIQFRGPTGTDHMTLTTDTAGAVHARRGSGNGTEVAVSSNGVCVVDTWHHFEIYCKVEDSGGRFQVWIDGVEVINFTGDTRNGGSDTTCYPVWGRTQTGNFNYSDLRVSSSSVQVGVSTVAMLLPNGNGNTSGLTGSDGNSVNNYQLVDEATPNGDTDYVFSGTQGVYDTYALADLPSGTWAVVAVQTTLNVKTSDGGSKFVRPVIRSGGSEATGSSVSVPASYVSKMQIFETNPVTSSAWTQSEVDALEVGPEIRDS